jgi:predicted alternative tryptophan synthase beta-subunit
MELIKQATLQQQTMKPVSEQCLNASTQEVTTDRYVDIPEAVQEIYRIWRPSPLFRAHNLEKALGTTCRIYYKYASLRASSDFAIK